MLAAAVYRLLGRLMRECFLLRSRVAAGAPSSEVTLLVEIARDTARSLQSHIDAEHSPAFDRLHRHLYWIHNWHARGQPSRCDEDVIDIFERDLPAVIETVEGWEEGLLDPALRGAIQNSWEAGRFDHALRDAFIYLESGLRRAGNIPPSDGSTGNQLADRLLDPARPGSLDLSGAELYAPNTEGDRRGVLYLFKGAFGYLRNPIAHRAVDFTPEAADEIVRFINLLLRIIGGNQDALRLTIPAAAATPELVEDLRAILTRYPGRRPVQVLIETDGDLRMLNLPMQFAVNFSPELTNELTHLLGPHAVSG